MGNHLFNIVKDPDLWKKMPKNSKSAHPYNPNAEFGVDNAEHEVRLKRQWDEENVEIFHSLNFRKFWVK